MSSPPRVGLQYQFTDDVMAYAKWSKGFKSGGWTTRLSTPIQDGTFAEFKPEFAETSEIGLKTQLLDNQLLVNTAIFYTDYEDIQLNFQEQASPVLRNAGTATLQGIEVEAQAVFAGGFGFTFAGGYIDAEYDEINPLVIGITTDERDPEDSGVQDQRRPDVRFQPRQRRCGTAGGRLHLHRRAVQRFPEHAGPQASIG